MTHRNFSTPETSGASVEQTRVTTSRALRRDLRRWLPLFLALAVVAGLSLYADAASLLDALVGFDWILVPAILGLTILNYLLRFAKWQYYLRLIGVPSMPWFTSLLIFFSGLAMVVTPGKVGEWLKSYLLREARGVPISVSAPVIIAERLTDGLAMLVLASGGLVAYGYGIGFLLVILIGLVGLVVVVQYRPFSLRLLAWGERIPVISGRVHFLRQFYESAFRLLAWRPLVLAVTIGVVSWGAECVAFYLILVGLDVTPSSELLLQATFVLAASTLIGSASMIPGGLGVAEGSLAGMLVVLGVTPDVAVAAAATLLVRLGTLWFGVSVGIVALSIVGSRIDRLAAENSRLTVSTEA